MTAYVYLRSVTFVLLAAAEGADCLLRLEQISQGPGLPASQLPLLLLQQLPPGSLWAGASPTRSGSFMGEGEPQDVPCLGCPQECVVLNPRVLTVESLTKKDEGTEETIP